MFQTAFRRSLIFRKRSLVSLADRFYRNDTGDKKPHYYLDLYERVLQHKRKKRFSLLEIGVKDGYSLLMWRKYFSKATIAGIDIRPCPPAVSGLVEKGDLHFIEGSQADPKVLHKALETSPSGQFDVIIDDAGHMGHLVKACFCHLFDRGLAPGGIYFIEDYGTAYRPNWPDGCSIDPAVDFCLLDAEATRFQSHDHGMVGVIKQLIDQMNIHRKSEHPLSQIGHMEIRPDIMFVTKK